MGAAEGQGTRTADAQRSEGAGRRVGRKDGGCADGLPVGTENGEVGWSVYKGAKARGAADSSFENIITLQMYDGNI